MKKGLAIILGITICLLIGFGSRVLQVTSMELWYPTLEQSVLTPPNWVFPVVWGILYVMLGISVGVLYCARDSRRKHLLRLFALQLLFNVSWTFFFFYMCNPMLGFANLLILDFLAILYFVGTLSVKRSSALFFLPYLLWVFFATYLNFYIFVNN